MENKPVLNVNASPFKHEEVVTYLLDEIKTTAVDDNFSYTYISNLLNWLTTTPKYTTYRTNTLSCCTQQVSEYISTELREQATQRGCKSPPVFIHPILPEVVIMGNWEEEVLNLNCEEKEVIVDISCGTAVLRGAHVFAPGVQSMSPYGKMKKINFEEAY